MHPIIQIGHGLAGASFISVALIWKFGFGEIRHTLSIIGAISILVANLYFLRSKQIIRWGKKQTWLKYHQRFASLGLSLVFVHSAIQPNAWHSWIAFLLASANFGTGMTVSFTKGKIRKKTLLIHSLLAPVLLVSIILHGSSKLDHDDFFPLTKEHDVTCVKCHTSSAYETYTCLLCHEHNTREIQFAHEVHGVIPYNPKPHDLEIIAKCLDCHLTKINDREYGRRRANWDYNPSIQ